MEDCPQFIYRALSHIFVATSCPSVLLMLIMTVQRFSVSAHLNLPLVTVL